jgi:hypothetical protein
MLTVVAMIAIADSGTQSVVSNNYHDGEIGGGHMM